LEKKNVLEIYLGFPDSSVGKESVYNAGDPSSIPGLGRSTGEELGYPLQYSWASLVAQLVENLPAIYLEVCCFACKVMKCLSSTVYRIQS